VDEGWRGNQFLDVTGRVAQCADRLQE
jgi:hypothetical protein